MYMHTRSFIDTVLTVPRRRRSGFTLIEVMIFTAIFSVVAIAFLWILVSVARIQVRGLAAAEVTTQSQFLLHIVQNYVERSSVVDISAGTPVQTLVLRMASSSEDPVSIRLSGTKVELRETENGEWRPLTSDKVELRELSFVRNSNPPARDSVSVSFTMEYASGNNLQRKFSHGIRTTIARVSAATFDSNIIPSQSGLLDIGISSGDWRSVNNTLFFSGSNVGVGISGPAAKLQISGGDVYLDGQNQGIILRSTNGSCFKTTVTDAGVLNTAPATCP